MTIDDLATLDLWSAYPAELRLAALLEAELSGEDFEQRCADLASHLGYSKPHAVKHWLNNVVIVPYRHLPKIADFIGVHLSVLAAFWLATYGADDDESGIVAKSIEPRITDGEFELIEKARRVFMEQEEDAAEGSMFFVRPKS